MKKKICHLAVAVTMLFAFNSCNTKADPDTPLKFSTLTVEQQKSAIEKNGLDLADKITGFQQTQGYVTLTQFINYDRGSYAPSIISSISQLCANLKTNDVNALENFNKQLRVASNVGTDVWGTWTWNSKTKRFDKASGVVINKAVLNFPANDLNSSVNNAVLTILYTESNTLIPNVNPAEFYPKSISVILKVDNTEALNAQYSGSYTTDGTPTNLLQTLIVGAYNWSATLTNTNTDVSANYTLKYNKDVLMKYDIGATGNFNATTITNSNSQVQDVITTGHMSIQLMNVAIYGGITDVKAFVKEVNVLKPDSIIHEGQYYSWTEHVYGKSYRDSEVLIFNKYLKFYGYFATENQKFADVEFFTSEEQGIDYNTPSTLVYTQTSTNYYPNPPSTLKYDYYNWSDTYNYTTNNYDYTFKYYAYGTKTVYNAEPRLILSDGSKITDLNTYANDNFKTLITKFSSLFSN